ncbi:MAG: hypothetical protein LBC94_02520 [Desulfovibrio sp.]|jgi:hypothetical protein|nr:hypothetical protein [Desulfovibrio sp.]
MTEDDVLPLLRQALENTLGDAERWPAFSAGISLTGRDAVLDSYEMLAFLLEVDRLLDEPGLELAISVNPDSGERPLKTIGTLAAHIVAELRRKREQA